MNGSDFQDPPTTTRQSDAEPPLLDEDLELRVIAGPDRGAAIALDSGTYVVGKMADCALRLSDPEVSRAHLELRVERGGILVRDLGSKNGSFYRGARITGALLGSGAVVTIGATQLMLARRTPPDAAPPSASHQFGRLLGHSPAMRRLFAVLERVAPTTASVLIEGETGTGKELCAEALHQASGRTGPLVVCDLAGISRSLIESELFGHVRGAFTGAQADRVGAFEAAARGTLFLDEIGELERDLQPRLLRALESLSVRRVGDTRYRSVDVRAIAATNRDLEAEVRNGNFRSDLFHRLAVVRVRIPPLRERREDIPFLVEAMLGERGARASPAALDLLQEHDWPGNVRELRNVIERARAVTPPGALLEPAAFGLDAAAAPPADSAATPETESYHSAKQRLLEDWERRYIDDLLKSTPDGVAQAARRSGLGRSHLYRLMQKYQIKP
jgi:DNA-binding NtrC family response regulator